MAFPTVQARNANASTTDATTYTATLPASIAAGDLLVAIMANDGTTAPTFGSGLAGWNVLFSENDSGTTACRLSVFYKIAVGGEGTLSIAGASECFASRTLRITGYDPNLPPAFATASDGGTGSANPNPPSLNPADWGTEDTLWVAASSGDNASGTVNTAFTAGPASYGNTSFGISTHATESNNVALGVAERTLNAASDDPGTFTRSTADDWTALTMGIRPTPAAPEQPILASTGFYSASGASPANNFTLVAGTDRRLMVSVMTEAATVSSMTYGGVSMAIVTDGTNTAASTNTASTEWWTLREADLPSDGVNSLVVNLSVSGECYINVIEVSGTDQSTNVDEVQNANTGAATTVTTTVTVPITGSLILSACNKNNTPHFTNFTVGGVRAMGRGSCSLPTGGAFVMNVAREVTATGSTAIVSTCESIRQVMSTVMLIPAVASVDGTAALTGVPFTGSGSGVAKNTGTAALTGVPFTGSGAGTHGAAPPAYISHTIGGASRSVTTASNCKLLVVAVIGNGAAPGRTGDFNGVTLDVASNSNDFVSLLYLLNPPIGTFTLSVTSGLISTVVAAQYSGDSLAFVSGQEASTSTASYSPSGAALVVHGICFGDSGDHTPESGTNEREDADGNWFGDRIFSSGATVNVGTTDGTDPDYAGAIFSALADDSADGTLALTGVAFTGSGSGTAKIEATAALTGVAFTGSGSGVAKNQATLALTGVPFTGAGSGTAKIEATLALTGVPFTASGVGRGHFAATAALTGVPFTASGTGVASYLATLALTGVPFTGAGSGLAKNQATLALTGVPFTAAGTGTAPVQATLALTGVPFTGTGVGVAKITSTLALTGVPFTAAGTGTAPVQASLVLTGVPFTGAGAGTAKIEATLALTGVPFTAAGVGRGHFVSDLALTGVPFAGAGVGSASNNPTANLALTGVAFEGSGTGTARLEATLALTGVPFAGAGTGAASAFATLGLTGVPFTASGAGQASYQAQLSLTGVPFSSTGSGTAKLEATLALTGVPFTGSGTGVASDTPIATLPLTGVTFTGSGAGQASCLISLTLTGIPFTGLGVGVATDAVALFPDGQLIVATAQAFIAVSSAQGELEVAPGAGALITAEISGNIGVT